MTHRRHEVWERKIHITATNLLDLTNASFSSELLSDPSNNQVIGVTWKTIVLSAVDCCLLGFPKAARLNAPSYLRIFGYHISLVSNSNTIPMPKVSGIRGKRFQS